MTSAKRCLIPIIRTRSRGYVILILIYRLSFRVQKGHSHCFQLLACNLLSQILLQVDQYHHEGMPEKSNYVHRPHTSSGVPTTRAHSLRCEANFQELAHMAAHIRDHNSVAGYGCNFTSHSSGPPPKLVYNAKEWMPDGWDSWIHNLSFEEQT